MYCGSVGCRTQEGFSLEEMLVMDLVLAKMEDGRHSRQEGEE